jgi:protein-disulfide isomerase
MWGAARQHRALQLATTRAPSGRDVTPVSISIQQITSPREQVMKLSSRILLVGLFCLSSLMASAYAEPAAGSGSAAAELSEEERQRELSKLMGILNARRSPVKDVDLILHLGGNPEIGAANAELVIAEFSTFHCGYCRRHNSQTMPRLITELIDTDRVRYVFFDYPVESTHPVAREAAEAGRCAADQGLYWELREHLFQNANRLQTATLTSPTRIPGLDALTFEECMETAQFSAAVSNDLTRAMALGIRGTPSFLVGFPVDDGAAVKVVKRITGAQPYGVFAGVVDELSPAAP